MLRPRRGTSLLELIIALGVGAIVIAMGGALGFRHQRFHRDIVAVVERTEQVEQVAALLPVALRSIAPAEGDIPPGGARDTSLEFRATIATAVVCDTSRGSVVLAPAMDEPRLASTLSRPAVGDTAWFLDATAARETWSPRAIGSVIDSVVTCRLGGIPVWSTTATGQVLRLANAPSGGGGVVRITRPWRYSVYRASDGLWYLGAKDWNASTSRFNTIQPVGGPFLSAAAGGMRFRYFDSLGAEVAPASVITTGIAAIEASLAVDSIEPGKYLHALTVRPRTARLMALPNRLR